jgi:hypothetical protein
MTDETRKEIERLCIPCTNLGGGIGYLARAILLLSPPAEPPTSVEDDAAMALLRELDSIARCYDSGLLPSRDCAAKDRLLAVVRKHLRPPMRLRIVPCESRG